MRGQGRHKNETQATRDVVGKLDHERPWTAPFIGTAEHGAYAWARRYAGTLTMREYATDVESLLGALEILQATEPDVTIVWIEQAPQHFHGALFANGSTIDRVERTAATCARSAWPPFLSGLEGIKQICESFSRQGFVRPLDGTDAPWLGCVRFLGDWRNQVVGPRLRARRIVRIPLAAALLGRGNLHVGSGGHAFGPTGKWLPDCTNWVSWDVKRAIHS